MTAAILSMNAGAFIGLIFTSVLLGCFLALFGTAVYLSVKEN